MVAKQKGSQNFKIYALIDKKTVFIGKTKGEIGPVYYRHCRAQNVFTTNYYYPPNSKKPDMYILETINCRFSESYRHIVAWVHIFQKEGYQLINPPRTIEDANDLHPKTADLIKVLQPASINDLLKETLYSKANKSDLASVLVSSQKKQLKEKKKRTKITLWATPEEKERFVAYAKSLCLTQSQTLQYLISKVDLEKNDLLFPDWSDDVFIRILEEKYSREIEQHQKIIQQLKSDARFAAEANELQSKKLNTYCSIAQKAAKDVLALFDSAASLPLEVEKGNYKDYVSKLPKNAYYTYPEYSGAALLRLQAVLLGEGNSPPRFILGTDQHGMRLQLRYYPRKYFFGIAPGNKRFSQRNSVWYMAWKKTGNVAELISAYPVQIKPKYQNPMDEHEIIHAFANQLVAECE